MLVAAKRVLMVMVMAVFSISMGLNAWAGECEEKLEKCIKTCTKKTLKADSPEEFDEMSGLDSPCDDKCFKRSTKCLIAAGDKETKGKIKKIAKRRKKVSQKICGKRFDKLMDRCRNKAKDDLDKLKTCYKKKVRPGILDCYGEVDTDLPMPAGGEN